PTNGFVSYRCNRQTQLVRGAHLRLFQALLPDALPYAGVSIPFVFCNPSTPQHLDRLSRRASTKKTSLIDDAPRGSFRFLPSPEKREHWRAPLGCIKDKPMIAPGPKDPTAEKAPGQRGNLKRGLSVPGGDWKDRWGNAARDYKRRALPI